MRNLGNRTRGRVVNFVWDGWDAALIVSKGKKSQTILGKRKRWEISSTDERDTTMMTKVSQPDQNMEEDNESMEFHIAMYSPVIDGSKSEKYMIAKAVATLSLCCLFFLEGGATGFDGHQDSDFCPTSPDESAPYEPEKVAFVREQLIDAIIYGLSGLLHLKQMAFDYFQEAVSFLYYMVGLEHFVIAILRGKDGKASEEHSSLVLDYEAWDMRLLDSLRQSATKCGVESFEDRDIAAEFIPSNKRIGNMQRHCSP
ncbi:hypothetical protein RHMOL_Rhmol10G0096900 [Rhododendron molle]|uniref:Uncharacterized protein n=1 Tax=Rhododendron molle TaxID=49168 RepID=A0ACC0M0Y5_RHOML|nr:hypothetical protein RHMOL_Rhmol10G0096900 [Rhododendron molle]